MTDAFNYTHHHHNNNLGTHDGYGSGEGVSTKFFWQIVFKIVLGISQYYLPMAASVLWAFFGIATFLTDSLYIYYLYASHLFIDEYVSALLVRLHQDVTGGACLIAAQGCYCPEGQDLSTFFWVIFVIWMEFGMWPPPIFKSVVLCTAFVAYALSLVLSDVCTLSGTLLSLVVGAGLGIVKIYIYSAVYATMVKMLAKRAVLKCLILDASLQARRRTAAAEESRQ